MHTTSNRAIFTPTGVTLNLTGTFQKGTEYYLHLIKFLHSFTWKASIERGRGA